jgi:tyrosinase
MATTNLRVRRAITELQDDYKNGNKKPLEDLMRAWKGIKALPPDDPNSFFKLGGFHGEPFRGAGWGSSAYWGGYCNHGNVLFPTWHRVYLFKLEQALQSIEGCADVMLPFWDETSNDSINYGIPWALTDEYFELDGEQITNPLRSFVFPKNIIDNINNDNPNYSKPYGYETVRYPLSGLVGTEADRAATTAHNDQFKDYKQNVRFLNQNVTNWLNTSIVVDKKVIPTGVAQKFKDCLDAPNYTVFSNTTSAAEWNNQAKGIPNPDPNFKPVVPLESPHNSIHLSVGGYEVPTGPNAGDFSPIDGANGDMGENDTAGLDPIFFFHHCFIDRVFWLWQKKNGQTDALEIIPEYPGTNTVDNQGPTPGMIPNSWLTMDSPLNPFQLEGKEQRTFTSNDCVNIEKQLGYTYGPGSLEDTVQSRSLAIEEPVRPTKTIKVSNINRGPIRGSFLISAFAMIDGKRQCLGTEAVLSRWNTKYCANCQTHLEASAFFSMPMPEDTGKRGMDLTAEDFNVEVEIKRRPVNENLTASARGVSAGVQHRVEMF